MKKYITVAALLAAGTAFANADVVAVFNCGRSENTGYMDQTKGWKDVLVSSTDNQNISGATAGSITLSSTGNSLSGTGPAGSFSAAQGASTSPYAIPDELETLSQGVFGDSSYDTLWGGSINSWTAKNTTLTLSGLAQNTDYTVYLFCARANGESGNPANWSTTTDSVSANWSVWTVADNAATKAEGSNTVQFDGDANGKNASIVEVTFNTGDATSVSFSTGDAAKFTLNGMVVDQGSTIPEPSAFGLLAGLGALALVASRRRRK